MVVVPWEDMTDADLMIDLFEAEMAPLHLWMDAARVYYNKGLKDQRDSTQRFNTKRFLIQGSRCNFSSEYVEMLSN
jgi:hypothetical protein